MGNNITVKVGVKMPRKEITFKEYRASRNVEIMGNGHSYNILRDNFHLATVYPNRIVFKECAILINSVNDFNTLVNECLKDLTIEDLKYNIKHGK